MTGLFSKRNTTEYADALVCEAEGLEQLGSALREAGVSGLRIPEVYRVDESVLEITAIDASAPSQDALEILGEGLALMHGLAQSGYGWRRNNYIGLAPQPNRWSDEWGAFFVRDRLAYQVSRVRDEAVRAKFSQHLEVSAEALADWLDEHCDHPSLLHGDLWNGNVLFDGERPWLIDPAVYCGDREADLAMTEMFGGFGTAFYEAYDRMYARSDAYRQKRDIYNLYHYLNHYNLFGSGYLGGCEQGFERIREVVSGKR